MNEPVQRDLGRLESKVQALEVDITEVRKDVKEILGIINQTKGGWKVLAIVGGVGGMTGGALVKFLPFLSALPK
ncbi:hypothetical protein UFOVP1672_33 [uncultured Caudovirales phage]|uniref:Uncharacterized protein n=1 Tax=uncultured Caudovirales phage TaxID=2100421 RepID=A0A6J5SBT7_9CAUD|nr:hypothetical protein UFOVP988_55 [uncultured Caudovirales phage]CAB4210947.1 hypothetical protein UFOVP1425_55 [uncultured Caudovirales phage]CAB4223378.1 hypothetical protein UFOVP1672_33 [uncultured Caudovirales phage]